MIAEAWSRLGLITVSRRTVFSIDLAHKLLHLPPQLLIHFQIGTARDDYLNKYDLPDLIWVLLEKLIHGVKLQRDSFDVVKSVDADKELTMAEMLPCVSNDLLNFRPLQSFLERGRLDSDWQRLHSDIAIVVSGFVVSSRNAPTQVNTDSHLHFSLTERLTISPHMQRQSGGDTHRYGTR